MKCNIVILVVLLGLAFHLSRMSLISQAFAPDSIFGMDRCRRRYKTREGTGSEKRKTREGEKGKTTEANVSATRTPSCKDSRRNAMLRHDQALKEGLDEVAKAGFRAVP
jgi:hypothetical protein